MSIKLTGRTPAQIFAAEHFLAEVTTTGKTTITFTGSLVDAERATAEAIARNQDRGMSNALHSIRRALAKVVQPAAEAPKAEVTDADRIAKAVKADDAIAARKAAEAPAPKPATGPRGEILSRKGVLVEDGPLAGYIVSLPFREFEALKVSKANADSVPAERRWATVCVEHGTHTFASNGTEAEKAGARKNRQGWCAKCAGLARLGNEEAAKANPTPVLAELMNELVAPKPAKRTRRSATSTAVALPETIPADAEVAKPAKARRPGKAEVLQLDARRAKASKAGAK